MTQNKDDNFTIKEPPSTLFGILRQLGPGLIIAGSIVGSGELIATTATGAKAGFWLLWLIILGCVIKVFVQVELGRYAITSGQGTIQALSEVPGPKIKGRGNWLIWYWFLMTLASIAQLGGIVGGVGQALSISAPITSYGRAYNQYAAAETQVQVYSALSKKEMNDPERAAQTGSGLVLRKFIFAEFQSSQALSKMSPSEKVLSDNVETLKAHFPNIISETGEFQEWRAKAIEPRVSDFPQAKILMRIREKVSAFKQSKSYIGVNTRGAVRKLAALEGTLAETEFDREIDRKKTSQRWIANYEAALNAKNPEGSRDAIVWAAIIAAITGVVLYVGRFGFIQSFSTAMVAMFTVVTIVNLFLLQGEPTWKVTSTDIINGLSFQLPETKDSLAVALATFGIIGVGATELIAYPYWCLEKGYASYSGKRDKTDEWAKRATGWLRVMRWDAWCSMCVYTFATIAFYLLGAAVLGRVGLYPQGSEMVRTLAVMYEPIFGETAQFLFLFGAFAVLYSTYFVANASHGRTVSDSLQVLGFAKKDKASFQWRVRIISTVFALLCFVVFFFFPNPVQLVLFSGIMQAVMLPMLAIAAIFFRYKRGDQRIQPSKVWDAFLIISAIGMLIVGAWAGYSKVSDVMDLFPV